MLGSLTQWTLPPIWQELLNPLWESLPLVWQKLLPHWWESMPYGATLIFKSGNALLPRHYPKHKPWLYAPAPYSTVRQAIHSQVVTGFCLEMCRLLMTCMARINWGLPSVCWHFSFVELFLLGFKPAKKCQKSNPSSAKNDNAIKPNFEVCKTFFWCAQFQPFKY